jgi:hypothetical protein
VSRKQPRPLGPVCLVAPIKRPWEMQTCGARCGAIRRWQRYDGIKRKALMLPARQSKNAANARRLVAYFTAELDSLGVALTLEHARILNRIYRRGRHDEYRKLMFPTRKADAA